MTFRFKLQLFALTACTLVASVSGIASAQSAKQNATKQPAALQATLPAPVETAALRITCDGKNAKAEVSINGVLKGECPFDAAVPAGLVSIKATKNENKVWEHVYEEQVRLGADIAKRVEIVLKRRQFRSDAVARMDAEVEALLSRKEAQQRAELPALERAAEAGDAFAMHRLGMIYKFGLAGPVDLKKAAYWFERGVQAKHAASLFELAMLERTGTPINWDKSVMLLRESAATGNPDAMNEVAPWLWRGEYGFQKNVAAAAAYYEKAAEAGIETAVAGWWATERELGRKNPDSIDRKIEQLGNAAREIGSKKADSFEDFDATAAASVSGFVSAKLTDEEYETGLRYSRMSMRYYKKAAATGSADEIMRLAFQYEVGRLTPKDLQTAANLYRQAIALGHKNAAERLARVGKKQHP